MTISYLNKENTEDERTNTVTNDKEEKNLRWRIIRRELSGWGRQELSGWGRALTLSPAPSRCGGGAMETRSLRGGERRRV